jgi:hypothetical protein
LGDGDPTDNHHRQREPHQLAETHDA